MKNLLLAFLSLAILIQAGCAMTATGIPMNKATISYDKFKDRHREYVQIGQTIGLNASRTGEHGRRTYNLTWNATTAGDSGRYNEFVLIVDGEKMTIRGDTKLTDVDVNQYSVNYSEFGVFPVTAAQIGKWARAKTIETKVYGENRNSPGGVWDHKRIRAINKFHRLFVLGEWDRMTPEEREEAKKSSWPPVEKE